MIIGIGISKTWFDAVWWLAGQRRHQRFEYTGEGIGQLLEQTPPGRALRHGSDGNLSCAPSAQAA
jgi:hypothetical protein